MPRCRSGLLIGVVVLGLAGCASGVPPGARADPGANERFAELLGRMQRGDAVDFQELRRAYVETDLWAPYGHAEVDEREKEMVAALNSADFERAGRLASEILEWSPLHPEAHFAAYRWAKEQGDEARAKHHHGVMWGIFDSICFERDGRDPERPCWVVATDEENFYIAASGLEFKEQGLGDCPAAKCDFMTVVDPNSGERFDLHFDISAPWSYLERRMSAVAGR